MRFSCPKCSTRYSVADEKVPAAQTLRFTCKKCGYVMRLRRKDQPAQDAKPVSVQPPTSEDTPVSGFRLNPEQLGQQGPAKPPQPPPPPPEEHPPIWFVLVGGKQVGPIAESKVLEMLTENQIDARTYAWREGMGDWLTLAKVPEFSEKASQSGDAAWRVMTPKEPNTHEPTPPPQPAIGDQQELMADEPTVAIDREQLEKALAQTMQAPAVTQPEDQPRTKAAALPDEPTQAIGDAALRAALNKTMEAKAYELEPEPEPVEIQAERAPSPATEAESTADAGPDLSEEPTLEEPVAELDDDGDLSGSIPIIFDDEGSATEPDIGNNELAESALSPFLEPGEESADTDEVTTMPPLEPVAEITADITAEKTNPVDVISAAAALAGVPTGQAVSRGGFARKTGSHDSPEDGDLDPNLMKPLRMGVNPDQSYIKAAPGEATRVFMATAGIFDRQRKNRIAAVVGSLVFCLVAGTVTLDLMGYIEIPGFGLFYSVTGFEDPNLDRAVKRVEDKLVDSNMNQEERLRLRQQLMGLNKKRKVSGPRVNLKPVVQQGIEDTSSLTKTEKDLATSIFTDRRKKRQKIKLAKPEDISTPNLPDGLTAASIYKVISDNNRSMTLCLTEAMRKGEMPRGKMEVTLTIAANGGVTQVTIAGFENSPMAECTIRRVKTWKFPKFNGTPVPVSFPYVLSAGL